MPRKSRLSAGAKAEFRRERVFAPLEILAFAALIIVVLALLFPGSGLVPRRIPLSHKEDAPRSATPPVTTATPKVAPELERDLADVRRLLADPRESVRRRALILELDIRRRHAYSYGAATQERQDAILLLRQRLTEVATLTWPARQLAYLATLAHEIGATRLYAELCDRSAEANPSEASRWLARAAQARLSVGDYHGAAESYFKAKSKARALANKRESFLAGLKALQSGNLLEDALRAAERHLEGLEDDRDTLI